MGCSKNEFYPREVLMIKKATKLQTFFLVSLKQNFQYASIWKLLASVKTNKLEIKEESKINISQVQEISTSKDNR